MVCVAILVTPLAVRIMEPRIFTIKLAASETRTVSALICLRWIQTVSLRGIRPWRDAPPTVRLPRWKVCERLMFLGLPSLLSRVWTSTKQRNVGTAGYDRKTARSNIPVPTPSTDRRQHRYHLSCPGIEEDILKPAASPRFAQSLAQAVSLGALSLLHHLDDIRLGVTESPVSLPVVCHHESRSHPNKSVCPSPLPPPTWITPATG